MNPQPPRARARPGGACRGAPPRLRLFLALWPDPAVRHALAAWRERCRWPPGAARVADERLHLTLHFIGAVGAERLDELAAGLRVPTTPFDLVLDRCVAWPRGLVVLEASKPPDALALLHAALGDALRRLRLPVEARRFRPHVTLARDAPGTALAESAPIVWRAGAYALVRSHGGAAGGYEPLWTEGSAGTALA